MTFKMLKKIKIFFDLIKFEHSIFALPFAYLGLFLAERGFPHGRVFLWVTVAMVAIRTSAMCLNRLIDSAVDEKNPRTQNRAASLKVLTRGMMWAITLGSLVIFIFACSQLNPLCLQLSPIPIALVWLYPHLKKFTWCSHFILGTILGIAPYAGWLSARPEWSWLPLLLTVSVTAWVSGFDMFYALQDVEFDRQNGLKSFPVRFGTDRTVWVVRWLHGVTILTLGVLGIVSGFGIWYWFGWVLAFGFILREHWMVGRFGLLKINEAFFNMNAWVSVVIFVATVLDLTLTKGRFF